MNVLLSVHRPKEKKIKMSRLNFTKKEKERNGRKMRINMLMSLECTFKVMNKITCLI